MRVDKLREMVAHFTRSTSLTVDVINLHDLRLDGGCRGCMRCTDGDPCGYKDQYQATFDQRVRSAQVVIHAGAVRDRYLSSRHKLFFDRFFSQGHRPVLQGKLMGFIISGPLGQLDPLRETLEASVEVARCHRLGIVTDETDAAARRVESMARTAERWVAEPWFTPPTFLGVGGHKLFRDLVYANKGVLSADHRFYAACDLYDFPQTRRWQRLFNRALLLCKRIPLLRRWVIRKLPGANVQRFRRQLASAGAQVTRAPSA